MLNRVRIYNSMSISTFEVIGVKMPRKFFISNFLRSSKQYFVWLMKVPSSVCLICNPKKYVRSPIGDISNFPCIKLANAWQRDSSVEPKIISSTYVWTKIICFVLRLINEVMSTLPRINPYLIKNILKHSYQYQAIIGVCLRL